MTKARDLANIITGGFTADDIPVLPASKISGGSLDLNGEELILDSDNDTSITADTDDRVDIKVAGSDVVHVTSTGLGIGASSPQTGLHVEASDGSVNGTIRLTATGVASSGMAMDANGLNFGADTGGFVFKTGATANDPSDTGTERVKIDSSGNVGIGTNSPDADLTLPSPSYGSGGTGNGIRFQNTNNDADAIIQTYYSGTSASALLHGQNLYLATNASFTNFDSSKASSYILQNTDGQILFANASSSAPSERMRIDSSGKVGIGTTSPTGKLTVDGGFLEVDVSGTQSIRVGSTDHIVGGTDNDAVLQSNTSKNMRFLTGSSERIRIDSSGNVGIGTTSPTQSLEVSAGAPTIGLNSPGQATNKKTNRIAVSQFTAGDFSVQQMNDDNSIGGTPFLITRSGLVGIGTTSPSYLLDVHNGDISSLKLTSAGGGNAVQALRFRVNNSGNTSQFATLGTVSAETVSSWGGTLTFSTKPANGSPNNTTTERMRIDSSGNVGIGTTAPLRQLHIHNTSSNSEIAFTAATTGASSILFGDGQTGTDVYRGYIQYQHTDDDMLFATSATERMRITTEGRFNINTGIDNSTGFRFFAPSGQGTKVAEFAMQSGVGVHLPVNSTAFTASSDETLKENITEFNKQESYDNIKNLRAVTFNYKDWTLNGIDYQDDKKRIGFIAQDWQANYPEVIDKDQNDKLCMKYTETIPVLLSALQKAQEKIEALETKVSALENK